MSQDTESLDKLERRVRDGLPPDEQFVIEALKEGLAVDTLLASDGGRVLMMECIRTGIPAFQRLLDPAISSDDERRALHDLRVAAGMLRMLSETIGAGNQAERRLTTDDADLPLEPT